MTARGYSGGGSAKDVRPPRKVPSAAHRPADPHGLRNLVGTGAADVQAQNRSGQWVTAIPLPLYGLRKRCSCGQAFWTMRGYRGHYALAHILGQED